MRKSDIAAAAMLVMGLASQADGGRFREGDGVGTFGTGCYRILVNGRMEARRATGRLEATL